MRLNKTFLASYALTAGVLTTLLGVIGIVVSFITPLFNQLPLFDFFSAFTGFLVGGALIAGTLNMRALLRLCGALLLLYALMMLFGVLRDIDPGYHQIPPLMALNLGVLSLSFLCYRAFKHCWMICVPSALFCTLLGVYYVVKLWVFSDIVSAQANLFEVSVYGLMMVVVGVTPLMWHKIDVRNARLTWRASSAAIIAVCTCVAGLWFYQSGSLLQSLEQRGRVSAEQTGRAINTAFTNHYGTLSRLAERVVAAPQPRFNTLVEESQRLYDDFPLLDAVMLLQGDDIRWHSGSKAGANYEHIMQPEFQTWRLNLSDQISIENSSNRQHRSVVLGFRVDDAGDPLQALYFFDMELVLSKLSGDMADEFSNVIRLRNDTLLSTRALPDNSEELERIINDSTVVVEYAYKLSNGYPLSLYAVLTDYSSFLQSIRVKQLVLLAGAIFATIMGFALASNRRIKEQDETLTNLATRDDVTQLYRRLFIEKRINSCMQEYEQPGWVFFIDLDGFKPINDSLGFRIGNLVLKEVALRLSGDAGKGVWFGRFSSDEFIVFVEHRARFDSQIYAKNLLMRVRERLVIEEFSLSLTASIGIYKIDNSELDASEVIQRADVAMSSAKASGGNGYRTYREYMARHYEQALMLRNQLQDALDQRQITVHYQPIINAASGRIESVEALARWQRSDGHWVSPMVFIPIAEQTGQIIQLGRQIQEQALREIKPLCEAYGVSLAINLSSQQFQHKAVLAELNSQIEHVKFPYDKLHLELTESIALTDLRLISDKLALLRERGVKIAIDDFGTGYSSLAYISKLPVDIIKLDRIFTREVTSANGHYPLLESILSLLKAVNKHIIIEGIETAEQKAFFSKKGCDAMQGYYFSKPCDLASLEKKMTSIDVIK